MESPLGLLTEVGERWGCAAAAMEARMAANDGGLSWREGPAEEGRFFSCCGVQAAFPQTPADAYEIVITTSNL